MSLADAIHTPRVGLAGWSRAAYWTDYVLIHSCFRHLHVMPGTLWQAPSAAT